MEVVPNIIFDLGGVALIERLAQRQIPLYCLSNMSAGTFKYLREKHAFWSAFRGIVISGEIQMMKPEPEIFEYLLRRYGAGLEHWLGAG
jgi:FMN phosphatase YigB (HAD superfamily)